MSAAEKPLYSPAPVQQEFHLCQANEILLGGAAGPGKSLALLMDPIQTQLAGEHQRWLESGRKYRSTGWALHMRREFPRLLQTIDRSHRIFRALDPGAHWNSQDHTWTFSCGYKIQFGHCKHDEDRINYQSSEYSHIAYDELSEMSQVVYDFINTRLRSSDLVLQTKLRIVAASNPSGNWVRDYFVAPAKKGRVLLSRKIFLDDGSEAVRTRIFIPATLKDNPDAGFRRQYEIELQDKPFHIREALLRGDWWVVAGAFFANEWIPPVHVCKPFKIPSGWIKFRSMDWGYKSPGTVLWWAVDTDGNLVCYRELTFQRMDAEVVAEKIRDIEDAAGEWNVKGRHSRLNGPADTQIWETRGTIGPTIAETFSEHGVDWEKCTKNRHASVAEFLARLNDRSGEKGTPGIRFFDTCVNTVRTIPAIKSENDNALAEVPQDGGEDHWLDAVLYACMYRSRVPKHDEAPRSQSAEDEIWEARKKKSQRKGAGGRYGYGSW